MPLFKRRLKNKDKKMPFFRKQSEHSRKRLEHQLYLSQENPEPTFDVSGCEISEIPSSVFPLCKVLQKEALLLYDNWLSSLKCESKITDLKKLRVLDLHDNELTSLPDDIGQLDSLQVLNLESNRLKKLPDQLGNLQALQTLNVKDNKLKSLPDKVCEMSSLRTLDIRGNEIQELPKGLCRIRTLETLLLDSGQMKYPAGDVCHDGTETIMKFLCTECGMEYLPPSNFLLNVLDPPKVKASLSSNSIKALDEENKLARSFEDYSSIMAKKHEERVKLERQFANHQREQAELAVIAAEHKQISLDVLTQDQDRMNQDLKNLQEKRDIDRQKLFTVLQDAERSAAEIVSHLLEMNEKARKTEDIMEAMEREMMANEEYFVVHQEEMENLRRQEVLDAMRRVLEESQGFEKSRLAYQASRKKYVEQALETDTNALQQVENFLDIKQAEHAGKVNAVAQQEKLQQEAFAALQLQKDARHNRINEQITMIQDELAQLTLMEIDKKEQKMETEKTIVEEKRLALSKMLMMLIEEKEMREDELKKRMYEMEEQRVDGQTDYWLVQYQRLMDRKPQALVDKESKLELAVLKILQKSNAEDYIPVFARHRISIETMLQLEDNDLKQMGVHELGLRKAILRKIADKVAATRKEDQLDKLDSTTTEEPGATAAAAASTSKPTPTAPAMQRQTSSALGFNSECCICMDKPSDVIFLTCGHVCCCHTCARPVRQCPMCRATISQQVRIYT